MAQTWSRTASYRAQQLTPGSAEIAMVAAVALLAAVLGWAVVRFEEFGTDLDSTALIIAGGVGSAAVILVGPVACLAALAGLTVGGGLPSLGQFGGINITLADVFYAGLVGWWLVGKPVAPQATSRHRGRPIRFGQGVAIVFLAYVGLTLLKVEVSDPSRLSHDLVSWLRLVQTASIAWLAASVITTGRELKLVLVAVSAGALGAIVAAVSHGGQLLSDRFTASPDVLGLVSGFLLLIAAFGGITPKVRYRIPLALAGLLGLLLAKSVASFVGTGFALALGAAVAGAAPAVASRHATRAAFLLAVAAIAVFGILQFVRPEVSPGSQEFKNSSAYQRIVLGSAGLEIFEQNPVIGAGWRESGAPKVIGARSLNITLRRRFPDANPIFYPDVQVTSVHNSYIQVLAELGLVGFSLFLALIFTVGTAVRGLLRRLGHDHELWPQAWTMTLGLVLVLIWLNDNPLYGGQPETVLTALLVGCLAATSRIAASE